jgi:hypothetical protein
MTDPTSPDNIVRWTNSDPASLVSESQAQGDSIQLALAKRERYTFVWANSSERNAQTGMVAGSLGYQVDTKTEYIYDSSSWRIQLPYAEFGSSDVSVATGTYVGFGSIDIDAGQSTSTTFALGSASNYITIVEPGIYSINVFAVADTAVGSGIAFTAIGTHPNMTFDFSYQIARGPYAADNVAMTNLGFYRVAGANQNIYFYHRHNAGSSRTIGADIRVGRLG